MPSGRAPHRAEKPSKNAGEPKDDIQGTDAGATIQLGEDFLVYVRQRFDPVEFKDELVRRLLPTVPRRGRPPPVEVGREFGKFQLEGELGKGGMAVVYKALDPERGSGSDHGPPDKRNPYVALKVMKDEIALDPDYVRRFLREAANAALISHRNVVKVIELGSIAGRLYFTMELIEGETLKDTLARGPLPEERGIQVLCQLLDGLVAAHDRGIGHRDLKPANVMLVSHGPRYGGLEIEGERETFDLTVKITDFGLAQMLESDTSDQMPEGHFLGTAKYIAPEVIKGGEPTLKSDLFSLGILGYQVFAGRPPWQGRTKIDFVSANLNAPAPRLDGLCKCSKELARVVQAMLEKEPDARPDAATLRKDLARLVARRRGVVSDPRHPTLDGPGLAQAARSPLVLAGAAALVVVVVVIGLALRSDDPPPPKPPPPPTTTSKAPPSATTTAGPPQVQTVGGGGGLDPVPLPPARAFSDQQGRIDFGRTLERGDAAWAGKQPGEALEQWTRAASLSREAVPGLEARLALARPAALLERADAAELKGDLDAALQDVEAAAGLGAAPAEVELRRGRLTTRQAREKELTEGLREAQGLFDAGKKDDAVAKVDALTPLARELGQLPRIAQKLERFGVTRAPVGPGPGPDQPPPPGKGRAEQLLEQAEGDLRARRFESAERALALAKEAGVDEGRARALAGRLARARATPEGLEFLEVVVPGQADPRPLYVRAREVTNRELAAWLKTNGTRFPTPLGWKGSSSPAAGTEDEPALGVDGACARAYAESLGHRLPDAAERAALRAMAVRADAGAGEPTDPPGRPREGPPEVRGRYERGFYTVRDATR